MSLYTVAQAESNFYFATNLDSSSTEKANKAGVSVSSSVFGTVTQNANSLTGNASYDFSSNGRVLHQWGGAFGISNFIHEIVFKRDNNPGSDVVLFNSLDEVQLILQSDGKVRAYVDPASASPTDITTSADLCDGKFHHIVLSYMDGSTGYRLYVDGTLIQAKTTAGNLTNRGLVNLGSYLSLANVASSFSEATIDFYAFYRDVQLTNAQVDTFVANHVAEFANRTVTDTPATASALAVNPVISAEQNISITETPATASAASGDHYNSTVDGFTTLNTYLSTLPLEQWYKFDEVKKIVNYGTGGTASLAFGGNSTSEDFGGIQGSGALRITGSVNDGAVYQVLNDLTMISPEITDGDFSVGFWIKANSAVADNNCEIWNAVNTANNRYNRFAINNSGKLYFQMNTNSLHEVATTGSICDDEWHFVVGKYNQSRMYLYVDGTLIGDTAVNYNNFSAPNVMNFGSNGTAATGDFFSVSQFFISSFSAITTTVINNIIDAAQGEFQAYANMEDPKISFNNSFNDLTETRGALVDLRFNEASGAPVNFGTASGVGLVATGGNITYSQLSPNTKAYRITNTNAKISAVHEFPTGTFSTNDSQTLMAYVKIDTGTAPSVINLLAASGHFGGDYGSGLGLIMVPGGAFRARLRDGSGFETITTSTTYADSQYHLVAATTDGSTLKLYVDGVQMGSTSTTRPLTDKILLIIGGEADTFGATNQSKSTYIDEVSVYNYAFTAEEIFNHFQAVSQQMDWTATAEIIDVDVEAGFGPTIAEPIMTASAEFANVFPFIPPMDSEAIFLQPNFEAIKNVSETAEAMTASAQGENPGFDIGENNQVLHMDASALFPDPRVLIPGKWNASPMIANPAEMVEPAISSTLGALIIAQSIPVQAIFVSPPAYKLITDDIWYQKLYLQHSVLNGERFRTSNLPNETGTSSASAFLKLFDDVTQSLGGANTNQIINNLPRSIVIDDPRVTDTAIQYATASNSFQTATPTPVLEVGTFDDYERKAVRFRNIQFSIPENNFVSDNGYSLEFTFKSTKSDQVIAQGFQQSFLAYQSATSSIGLVDGKLYATRATQGIGEARIFAHPDNTRIAKYSFVTAYGNKRIDDGAWHHLIIQYGFDGRVQFWIDGELDIQFFADSNFAAGAGIRPYIIGSNHSNSRWQSDFETSAWSYDAAFFVDSENIIEHYTASIKYEPVQAEPATATAEMGQGSKAEGNRGRALMLYFWPTAVEQGSLRYPGFTSTESSDELTTLDYFTKPPQEYEGWDVFPVDVTGYWVSDLVKVEAYGAENIGTTNFITTVSPYQNVSQAPTALFNKRRTFRDPLTDAARYIDLLNDIDLSKFDMIMFKNYPNDPREKDAFTGAEVVDAYFNLRESFIFEEFVKSLRAAVDTGISLMVANAQLALDLKIVDRVETVPDMDDNVGQGDYSDPYAPTQMFGVTGAADLPIPPEYDEPLGWRDTWKNNRTRIVNTHPGITDYPELVKTQQAFWKSSDEFRWGGADRYFIKYENKDALAVGDEFIISTTGLDGNNNRAGYLATPFENVKAGKIITAFANTVRRGLDEIENPYRNYAQSIILEPGDVLDGTQVGGKIYVNFTEEINKCQEVGSIELISPYWINYHYDNGGITLEERDQLLAQPYVQSETPYWSVNGMNLLQQRDQSVDLSVNYGQIGGPKTPRGQFRKINKKTGAVSFQALDKTGVFFSSTYSWAYPMMGVEIPSMPTRGFRWLSFREVLEGTVLRPQAFAAAAEMPNAAGVPDRVINVSAQSMVATALLEETNFSSGERIVLGLPMEANATIVKPGSTIGVQPMLANAGMFANSRAKVASEDQVVLQIIHVDPILYIREDVIK